VPDLELDGIVPGGMGGVGLYAGGERPLASEAQLAEWAHLGEERAPLIASTQILALCSFVYVVLLFLVEDKTDFCKYKSLCNSRSPT